MVENLTPEENLPDIEQAATIVRCPDPINPYNKTLRLAKCY
jgi:hypothetical protein